MASARKKIIAGLIGVVLIGTPVGAFNYGLHKFIDRQGQEDVETAAQRAIALGEARIGAALSTLQQLNNQGIAACTSSQLDVLRRATVTANIVKDLSIVDVAGETVCSVLGIGQDEYKVIASQELFPDGEAFIDVLQVGGAKEPMIRLRHAATGLAALVPADLKAVPGNASGTQARLALRDGTTIATVGANPETPHDPASRLTATVRSERYGIIAAASMSQADVTTAVSHLHALGLVITGVIAVLILVFAFIALRGSERNPMTQISEALEAGQFVPYYQPIIDIKTGRLRGAEVLARWCKPDASVVSPAEFIALMETSGLIFEFTRAIMGKARDEVGLAYQCRPDLHLAFNVSAHHLAEERVVDELKELFDGAAVRLSQIVIELTERQPLEDLTEGRRVIAALQGLGVRIAIDDVGTGHSGLSYMLKLGPDIVKIDKMFVDAAISDRNSSNIIETLVDLAGKLRMDLIAEGVQTFDQLTYLREIGVSMAQGYVFAPPLPGPSFLRLVDAANPASPPAEEAIADPPRSAARN